MHEAKNDNVRSTSHENESACQPQKRLAHGLRFIECKVTDLFLHFQKNLSFSNEGKERTLTQIYKRAINNLSSTNSRLRGLNVEEVGGRRESQSPTPNRAVRKGCYSIDA